MPTSLPEHFEDFAEARREGFLRVKELKDKLLETKIARKKLKLNDVENSARILDDIIMGKDSKKIENRQHKEEERKN